MWWFIGIKQAVEKLEEEVKQLKCKHPVGDNIFTEKSYYAWGIPVTQRERKCSKCGAVLEAFGSELTMQIAKGEWHKKEAERLDVDKILGTEYLQKKNKEATSVFEIHRQNGIDALKKATESIIAEDDYIQKRKGRWVHVKSGVTLKVRK